MISVRAEWRPAFENTDCKYTKRVQQWDHEYRKPNGRGRNNRIQGFRTISRIYKFQNQNRIHYSNEQGSRVAHKYFCWLKIKNQKCQQTSTKRKCKYKIWFHAGI